MHLDTPAAATSPYAARRMHTTLRLLQRRAALGVTMLLAVGGAAQAAAPSRAESLAKFDAGYAQCEQRFPDMRGQRDKTYAAVWRLRLDDTLAGELTQIRESAPYKRASQRATRTLTRNAAASDVSTRLDRQCRGLQRELAR